MTSNTANFRRHAYARMRHIRQFEAAAYELTKGPQSPITGSIHPCAGQEAIPVGALAALRDTDRVIATYRGHGWVLEAGVTASEAMAEMCHRQGGINGGRAGSLMMMAPDRRFIGENSIVGAGGPVACGVAMASKVRKDGGVVVVSFGDGALSQGGLHEAFVTAASLKLPVIFVCENNEWAEMTPTDHCVLASIAGRAANYGMAGEEVDGCDPEAVRDAVSRAAARARAGDGPTLIECQTVRLWGHYNLDIEHYRPKANRVAAEQRDPIARLRKTMLADSFVQGDIESLDREVDAEIETAVAFAKASPHPERSSISNHLFASPMTLTESSAGVVENMTYAQAVNRALDEEMATRPDVILMGEDVGKPGGVFGLSRGLQKQYGEDRVIDMPIAETAILGSAVGAAVAGLKPIAEIMFADFMFVALDQVINQAANIRYVSNGRGSAPLVVRTQQGATPGSCAQHAQCIEAHLANIPGIKVGLPITPQDAYAMLRAAIADPDPCVIVEARIAFGTKGDVMVGGQTERAEGARLERDGTDLGIISWGTSVPHSLRAAELAAERGVSAAVLNLRWLSPIDDGAIARLVEKCGRILIVHEASVTGGFGAEIAMRISERGHDMLIGPVRRLGGLDVRMPASPVLQKQVIPQAEDIVKTIFEMTGAQAPAFAASKA